MKIQSDLDILMEQVGCKLRTYRENDGLKKQTHWPISVFGILTRKIVLLRVR